MGKDLTEAIEDIGTTRIEDSSLAVLDPFVQMVERLATNEAIDADKLDKLVSIQMRVLDRAAEADFNIALADVQANLPTVAKDAMNDHTRSSYARHETIASAIKPLYTSHGFSTSFSQGESSKEGTIRIRGTLRHRAGHSAEYFIDLPLDTVGAQGARNKTDLHGTGSTFTYGRRYLTCLMFDVATGDDTDGAPSPDPLTEEQARELHAMAVENFGDERAPRLLHNLAEQYFRIKGGDYAQIPAYRFEDAKRKLRDKMEGKP